MIVTIEFKLVLEYSFARGEYISNLGNGVDRSSYSGVKRGFGSSLKFCSSHEFIEEKLKLNKITSGPYSRPSHTGSAFDVSCRKASISVQIVDGSVRTVAMCEINARGAIGKVSIWNGNLIGLVKSCFCLMSSNHIVSDR